MVGSTAQHLNVRELKGLRVPVPPVVLQDRYCELIRRCEVAEEVRRCSERGLSELVAALQHRAFAGQL
jgi:type I restriction enzyme S subunit